MVRRAVVLLWVGASLVAVMAHGARVLNPVEFACRNQVIVSAFVLEVQHLDPVWGAARPDGMVPLISDCQGQVVVEDVLRDETQALAKGDTTSVIYCCSSLQRSLIKWIRRFPHDPCAT